MLPNLAYGGRFPTQLDGLIASSRDQFTPPVVPDTDPDLMPPLGPEQTDIDGEDWRAPFTARHWTEPAPIRPEPTPPPDRRRVAVCRRCGDTVERPTAKYPWSHRSPDRDREHEAEPFPQPIRQSRSQNAK